MFFNKEVLQKIESLGKELKALDSKKSLETRKKVNDLADLIIKNTTKNCEKKIDELKVQLTSFTLEESGYKDKYFKIAQDLKDKNDYAVRLAQQLFDDGKKLTNYKIAEGRVDYLLKTHHLFNYIKIEDNATLFDKVKIIDQILFDNIKLPCERPIDLGLTGEK